MTPWGHDLGKRGYSVQVPRLPGHGTTWQEMNTMQWQDWYGEVDVALSALHRDCDTVVVGGLSMGGCLALRLAEQRPRDVDALILVNPAIALRNRQLLAVPILKHVLAVMPGIGNDIKKPGADELGYDKTPLRALHSQLKMWNDVRTNLAKVTQPLLYFHSTEDHVVDDATFELVMSGISSAVKRTIKLRNSYHVATLDHDAPLLFDESASFIESLILDG